MRRFVLSSAAFQDLADIDEYIYRDNPAASIEVLESLRLAMRKLAQHPGMGHQRSDLADETLRVWVVFSYLIIYRGRPGGIDVVRVIHGARDVAAIMGEIDDE